MKRLMLLGLALGVVFLAIPVVAVELLPEYCHASNIFNCLGQATVLGTTVTFNMSGGDALARVETFEKASKSRGVTWTNFQMKGLTKDGAEITASLDQSRKSSGTLLSVGNTKFPSTATMRFFLRLETGGMTMVSNQPAVFQGIIHSIPPAPGDSFALINGPVSFHEEGGNSRVTVGTLEKSKVVYHERGVTPLDMERDDRVQR